MDVSRNQNLLKVMPSINDLLSSDTVAGWLAKHPRQLVTACISDAIAETHRVILADQSGQCGPETITPQRLLDRSGELLVARAAVRLGGAINATGVILNGSLGRTPWAGRVVDSMTDHLKGYCSLELDRETGLPARRERHVEEILCELTGAEAATVVNNNAAATVLALAAATVEKKEVIVSRGHMVDIGGAYKLSDAITASGAKSVEVGSANRTVIEDYEQAIGEQTGAILRVRPMNFRLFGDTADVPLEALVNLGRAHWAAVIDDVGFGALVDLAQFGLPHEPTVRESIAEGTDVVLFSADKLIGAAQGGVIVGRRTIIEDVRTHPMARALRVGKTALMAIERTLQLFRDVDLLRREHPLYVMLSASAETLRRRAGVLAQALADAAPGAEVQVVDALGFLASEALPLDELPTSLVKLAVDTISGQELARRLRLDPACILTRTADDQSATLDVRTIADLEIIPIAQAVSRVLRG